MLLWFVCVMGATLLFLTHQALLASTPEPEALTSAVEYHEQTLQALRETPYDPPFIQLLETNFLELTKNWICNVVLFPVSVLDRTVFVATDKNSFNELVLFSEEVKEDFYEINMHYSQ